MDKDLIELIKSKLPEAEVGAVKAIISELEQVKESNKVLCFQVEALSRDKESLEKRLKVAENNNKTQDYIEHMRNKNQKKEDELKDKEAQLKAEVPKAREEVMKYVFDTIFKVPTTRENYQEKVMGYTSQYNNQTGSSQYSPSGESLYPVQKVITQE